MGQSELTTAKYFEQAEQERATAANAVATDTESPKTAEKWARAYSWISAGIALAIIACVTALAIPYLTGVGSWQRKNPIDWLLWLGGARSDQTFEKYIRDSAAANQREWDDRYRESPAFQFDSTQFRLQPLDSQQMGWHPEPSPRRHSK
jgi:hypothetical protein